MYVHGRQLKLQRGTHFCSKAMMHFLAEAWKSRDVWLGCTTQSSTLEGRLDVSLSLTQASRIAQGQSVEEARARRDHLAKMRSLLFHQEAKLKHLARIKSRDYHRRAQKAAQCWI